ncbi:hypothetical protein MHAS_03276 [Mycolicibacterium hassiacum DSM 44199]|nr:hypothetical protein MHAS_03276 [Mycolicibacterium hassiacum DSM 44199]
MTTGQCTRHPFDAVLELEFLDGRGVRGRTVPEYANMVGPFGGATAAVLLRAIEAQPDRVGEPVALTVTYAAPIAYGEFDVDVDLVRINRTNQHWMARLTQGGEMKSTAMAIFGTRRQVWSDTEEVMPAVGEPHAYPVAVWPPLVRFLHNYEARVVDGGPPTGEAAPSSVSTFWVRHTPARRLDFPALAALADVFFPRIFARLGATGAGRHGVDDDVLPRRRSRTGAGGGGLHPGDRSGSSIRRWVLRPERTAVLARRRAVGHLESGGLLQGFGSAVGGNSASR